jgi:hypothetical protein
VQNGVGCTLHSSFSVPNRNGENAVCFRYASNQKKAKPTHPKTELKATFFGGATINAQRATIMLRLRGFLAANSWKHEIIKMWQLGVSSDSFGSQKV